MHIYFFSSDRQQTQASALQGKGSWKTTFSPRGDRWRGDAEAQPRCSTCARRRRQSKAQTDRSEGLPNGAKRGAQEPPRAKEDVWPPAALQLLLDQEGAPLARSLIGPDGRVARALDDTQLRYEEAAAAAYDAQRKGESARVAHEETMQRIREERRLEAEPASD